MAAERAGRRRRGAGTRAAGKAARTVGALGALLVVLAGTAGCGIRTTPVPVDAGAAPSRVSCDVPAKKSGEQPRAGSSAVRVFLVCGAGLVSVQRVVGVSEETMTADRMRAAQALLDELQQEPSEDEQQAGFSTDVRGSLTVSGPRAKDARETLRLSRQPDDLPTHALAQIVCTYSGSAADAGGGSVQLGGPSEDPPRKYQCTAALKARPETVPTLGEVRRTTGPASGTGAAGGTPAPRTEPSAPRTAPSVSRGAPPVASP